VGLGVSAAQAGSRQAGALTQDEDEDAPTAQTRATRRRRRGEWLHGQARSEQGGRRAHDVFQGEAKLTTAADGEERRRMARVAKAGGAGGRGSPGLLHSKGGGQLRGGIGRVEGGEAPHTRNRVTTHRRRRIAAATELQAAAMEPQLPNEHARKGKGD